MNDRQKDLCKYRISQSKDSLEVAEMALERGLFKDSINRSYYAAFYAVKAVLALEVVDFKRHKDVMAYFNKTYVATERFPRELGRKLGKLQQLREKSDYDDFYLASREVAEIQVKSAKMVMEEIIKFIQCVGVGDL